MTRKFHLFEAVKVFRFEYFNTTLSKELKASRRLIKHLANGYFKLKMLSNFKSRAFHHSVKINRSRWFIRKD